MHCVSLENRAGLLLRRTIFMALGQNCPPFCSMLLSLMFGSFLVMRDRESSSMVVATMLAMWFNRKPADAF